MGMIKEEEIIGYRFENGEIVCNECVTKEEIDNASEDEILIENDREGGTIRYFCDRCKKELYQ